MEVDEQILPHRRDPDALPPSNFFERISDFVYQVGGATLTGNVLYALKAALLSGTSCLESDSVVDFQTVY